MVLRPINNVQSAATNNYKIANKNNQRKEKILMLIPQGKEIKQLEFWKPIPESVVPGIIPYYYISTYGRVLNTLTGSYLPQNINYNKDKYITISLSINDRTNHIYQQPHRLVMMVFNPIDHPELYDVNHLDGIKYHNWIWNLEWATHKENINHGFNTHLFPIGEERTNSKLTNDDIHTICKYMEDGYSALEIENMVGKINGCDIQKIYHNIRRGASWKCISSEYDLTRAKLRQIFTKTQVDKICLMIQYNQNISTQQILANLGYTFVTKFDEYDFVINCIRDKTMYRRICDNYNY